MIGVVNYGAGNVHAILNQYDLLNIEHMIISNETDFKKVDKIILPGVGSFDYCKKKLYESNLIDELNSHVIVKQKPTLGICVGMQLLADSSDEGVENGLSWIPGKVKKFNLDWFKNKPKLPHMGWNKISVIDNNSIFKGISEKIGFYFVHSYYFEAKNKDNVISLTNYGINFHSAVQNNNIFGVQFHPEKSQNNGILFFDEYFKKIYE